MSAKILCVDDDANIVLGIQRNLRKQFNLDVATGSAQGLDLVANSGPYAVIVADMQMPGLDGIGFLTQVQAIAPDTVRIMLTGLADQQTAILAVNQGKVFQFLTKPCPIEVLILALEAGLKQYRLITTERDLLERTLNGSVKMLMEILSVADPQSFGHSQVLRNHMAGFARSQGCGDVWALEMAAMLCLVGCVSIPPAVIKKLRDGLTLTGQEMDMIARVPRIGSDLICSIPRMESVAQIILYQAKNFDGSGFPEDLIARHDIPLGSRILRVLFDLVKLEDRGIARARAIETMRERPGIYDPDVLAEVSDYFHISVDSSSARETFRRHIPIKELRAGMLLLGDLRTVEGMLIVQAGTRITPMLMERLQNFAQICGVQEPVEVASS